MKKTFLFMALMLLIGAQTAAVAQELTVSDFQNSGCLGSTRASNDEEAIVLTKEGTTLKVQLFNYWANCAAYNFSASASNGTNNGVYLVSINVGYDDGGATCMCPYNISFSLHGLEVNSFFLSCLWYNGLVDLTEGEPLVLGDTSGIVMKEASIDGFNYTLEDITLTATLKPGSYEQLEGDLNIPSEVSYEGQKYSVKYIGEYALAFCGGLTSVTIPRSVVSIGHAAFYGCSGLEDVYCFADNVPTTVRSAFQAIPLATATLHVPAASVEKYKATSPWNEFGSIEALYEPNTYIQNIAWVDGFGYEQDGQYKLDNVKLFYYTVAGDTLINGKNYFRIQRNRICKTHCELDVDEYSCETEKDTLCFFMREDESGDVWFYTEDKNVFEEISHNTLYNDFSLADDLIRRDLFLFNAKKKYAVGERLPLGMIALDSPNGLREGEDYWDIYPYEVKSIDEVTLLDGRTYESYDNYFMEGLGPLTGPLTGIGTPNTFALDFNQLFAFYKDGQLIYRNEGYLSALEELFPDILDTVTGKDLEDPVTNYLSFVEEGKVWHYEVSNPNAGSEHYSEWLTDYMLEGDTIIGNYNCKKLYVTSDCPFNKRERLYSGALFEKDSLVYHIYPNGTEPYLLYDFTPQKGDDVSIGGITLTIRDRQNIPYNGKPWLALTWNPKDFDIYKSLLIEGIGCPDSEILNYYDSWTPGAYRYKLLSCEVNGKEIFSTNTFPLINGPVTFTAGQMATIVLPTAPDASKGMYFRLDRWEDGKIAFEQELHPQAHIPYIIIPNEDFSINPNTLDIDGLRPDTATIEGVAFIGRYDSSDVWYKESSLLFLLDMTPDCANRKNLRFIHVGHLRAYFNILWRYCRYWEELEYVLYLADGTKITTTKESVTFTAGQMATIVLPTEPDAGKGKYYRLDRCEDGQIIFEQELHPQAHIPYIIVPSEDFSIDPSTLDLAGLSNDTVSVGGISFIGSYTSNELNEPEGFYIDIIDTSADCQVEAGGAYHIGALRAYLQVSWDEPYNHGGSKAPGEKLEITLKDYGTGLTPGAALNDKGQMINDNLYDLSGRKQSIPQKGMNIIRYADGIFKKVLIK